MEEAAAKLIGAGLAVIGVIGAGIGIGNVFSAFITAVGRNPAARGEVSHDHAGLCARGSHRAVCAGYRSNNPVRLIHPSGKLTDAST